LGWVFAALIKRMPRPIPPPPPQPTQAETKRAVRFVRVLCVITVVLFGTISAGYHNNSRLADYGRNHGQAWNHWKAQQLDEETLRAHPGGRIVWLVGSSILRESFDEDAINTALSEQNSPWRVSKFGQTRGTSGVSIGMLRQLPLRSGDRVLHNVAISNYRKSWLRSAKLPSSRLLMMRDLHEIREFEDWAIQDRLEALASVPPNFYANRDAIMDGQISWVEDRLAGKDPQLSKPRFHLKYRTVETLRRSGAPGPKHGMYIAANELDFGPTQFNIDGLEQIRALCAANEADLFLLNIPQRQEYMAELVHEDAREAWTNWRDAQPEMQHLPQLDEDDYYDFTHPNFRGRKVLTSYLIDWLNNPTPQQPAQLNWLVPDYNRSP